MTAITRNRKRCLSRSQLARRLLLIIKYIDDINESIRSSDKLASRHGNRTRIPEDARLAIQQAKNILHKTTFTLRRSRGIAGFLSSLATKEGKRRLVVVSFSKSSNSSNSNTSKLRPFNQLSSTETTKVRTFQPQREAFTNG